ncbi:methylated-DNA--[protein]-cysteine S-methyltransferase [Aquabacterium sp.]|uniref:methylated-DNA--[protein]-cysteine S-methyltransferase n=1 Tax=Aquabacterium sp. TaxID=1872578 RepID=UPI003D6D6CD3
MTTCSLPYTAQALIGSPLGDVRLACTAQGLAGAWFTDGTKDTPGPWPEMPQDPTTPVLSEAARQFGRYWAGQLRAFELPLDPQGTPFQRAVWLALLTIPFGTTATYGEIAARIGQPKANQAVGLAVGANPLIVIVPCHRVIGRDARLTGFSSGLPRKVDLLRREGLRIEGEFVRQPDAHQARLFADDGAPST